MKAISPLDLEEILSATAPLWEQMRGKRLFLTGGTGFFGTWLLESFIHANITLGLQADVTILTRNPDAFAAKAPHLAQHPSVTLLAGDVRDFAFPAGQFDFLIHGATEASAWLTANRPQEMLSTIVQGTGRVLEFARHAGTRKLLITSSGAVYGAQPHDQPHVPEEFSGAPDSLSRSSVYGEGKRYAELLCSLAANDGLEIKVARCFAFVGPHLPLDTHFAIGNFLADALAARPIQIAGDGTSLRSYLYASDLAIWLWTILFQAPSLRAYNVGSEAAVSIRDLAHAVSAVGETPLEVSIAGQPTPGRPPARYVPSTQRAESELGLSQKVGLEEALRRTLAWHRLKS